MLNQEYKIVEKLQAYDRDIVLRAFKLFEKVVAQENSENVAELIENGWTPQKDKPDNGIPFYYLFGSYWVLPSKNKDSFKKKLQARQVTKKPVKKTSMELKQTQVPCPYCGAATRTQKVCPMCKDGRAGFSIRLLCEENPDHEILL